MAHFKLHPPQIEGCKKVYADLKGGKFNAVLLVLATGVGKTIAAAGLVNRWTQEGSKVLFLAHREELINQAADKFLKARDIIADVERSHHKACLSSQVVIGSVQTMQGKRLLKWPKDHFDYIIIDEAHRSVAKTYINIFKHFDSAKLCGLTATAYRTKGSLSKVYKNISYEFGLKEAIAGGYLCPIKAKTIPIQIDLKKVRGDYTDEYLGETIEPYIEQIAMAAKDEAFDRKIILFAPLCSTAKMCRDVFKKIGFNAFYADGNDRSEIKLFEESGTGSILCNSMLTTEGYDHPPIDCCIILRPTKSTGLYAQMVGRITRLFKDKEFGLILDFLWNSADHQICKPACLVADDEDVEAKMSESIDKAGGPVDIMDEEVEAVSDIANERERALANKLQSLRDRKSKNFDPVIETISLFNDKIIEYKPSFEWEKEPASSAQVETLKGMGFSTDGITKGYASQILDGVSTRRDKGLCSPKQMRSLIKNADMIGIDPASVKDMTFDQASSHMNEIVRKLKIRGERSKNYKKYMARKGARWKP